MQSPEVYRLDFTDEGDQSGDQEALERVCDENDTEASVSETNTVVNDTSEHSMNEKCDKTKCDQENSVQQTGNRSEYRSNGIKNETCANKGETVNSKSKQLFIIGTQHGAKKIEGPQSKRKGTKSKDIWTDSNSSSKKKIDISENKSREGSSNTKTKKHYIQGIDSDKPGRTMSSAFSKSLKEVCFNVPKDNRIVLEVIE